MISGYPSDRVSYTPACALIPRTTDRWKATGAPTDYGTTVYRPPAALRDLVITRTPIAASRRAWPPPTAATLTTANPTTRPLTAGPPTSTTSTPTAGGIIALSTV